MLGDETRTIRVRIDTTTTSERGADRERVDCQQVFEDQGDTTDCHALALVLAEAILKAVFMRGLCVPVLADLIFEIQSHLAGEEIAAGEDLIAAIRDEVTMRQGRRWDRMKEQFGRFVEGE